MKNKRLSVSSQIVCALAVLYTLYFAQSLILPILVSCLLTLLLSPIVTKLKEIHIPRSLSSLALIIALISPFATLSIQLSDPVERWINFLPELSLEISQKVNALGNAFEQNQENGDVDEPISELIFTQENPGVVEDEETVVEQQMKKGGVEVLIDFMSAAPLMAAQVLGSAILILFLLVFGPSMFDVFVNDFPIVKNKNRVTMVVRSIQLELSKYILTISAINFGLGIFTWLALSALGVEDALLFGAIVGFLNFAPYVGPLACIFMFLVVGVVQFDFTIQALFPASAFLVLNLLESQVVTPGVLGKSMKANPLVIILWLFMLGWLWGALGVLLALPLLVCIKLALQKLEVLPHWLKLIESKESPPSTKPALI